jgi:cytochrome P450
VREPALRSLRAWYDYFGALVDRRRGDHGSDLLSLLVQAEEDGDRLNRDELIGTLTVLVQAGHETTSNLVTNGLLALVRHPEQYRALRADPERAGAVVEEVLRYDGPARGQPRVATEGLEVGGKEIAPGDLVMVIVNAANRDPARFPDPDRFDIGRDTSGHLAFASGIHYCVGAALARMEAEVAFRAIAEEPDVFALATDRLQYKPSHGRNLVALPVERRPATTLA